MKLQQLIRTIWDNVRSIGCYIEIDPRDNSITFSPRLVKLMRLNELGTARAILHKIRGVDSLYHYGISINPEIPDEAFAPDVQYNVKYNTFGFEANVNGMLHDLCLSAEIIHRARVKRRRTDTNHIYYQICLKRI